MNIKEAYRQLENAFDEMVAIRRHLHQYPEKSFEEFKTAAYIANYYEKLGIPYRKNVGGNGIVARINGTLKGPTIALRADFDGLPIQDEKAVSYASKVPGVMHACGHDGHTAMLLVLAAVLNQYRHGWRGTVVLIHQHGEEYAPGGAKAMIEDGCLEGVDVIFGTHLWATEPVGNILYRKGPFMAAADRFEVKIQGQGGHGAEPHKTKDSIVIASQFITYLQQLVSRRISPTSPAVVTVGSIRGGDAFNVIADQTTIIGTARSFQEDVRIKIEKEIEQILKGVCIGGEATYEYEYVRGYPPVVNHEEETEFLINQAKTLEEVQNVIESDLIMGGEDFSYYLQHVKGCFFFTGAKSKDTDVAYPHHHPKFDFDEGAMLIGAKTLMAAAFSYSHLNTKNLIG